METLEWVLETHPFFSGLPETHRKLLVGCASQARFAPGEFILRMDNPADHFYLIRHGRVSLELNTTERGPIVLQTVSDGEALGWSWLVPPFHWNLDGRAIESTLLLAFDAACLRDKIKSDHNLGYELFRRFTPIIAERLQAARLQILDVHRNQS
jgi:signal-transduction protein with cAMP-binding, CBS, and nucleotidyltransferase domain